MFTRTAAALVVSAALTVSVAYSQSASQSAPNPTQHTVAPVDGPVPIFRITVVGRTTPAINYRPRRGDTKIDFSGTPLMPQAHGDATVSGEQGYIQIDAHFKKLTPAARFGREYLTYVLWAVTPDGRAANLGEIQVDDEDADVKVTTQLQAFGLIVTAEPYFAVSQPSDVVVMENVVRDGTKGSVEVIQARYELLKRGAYLMNQDASALKVKEIEPGSRLDLAQARNAVELARLAGADRFAAETFNKAVQQLALAETARERRRGGNEIMMPARQAAQTAEDARLVGLQRQEEAYQAEQRALALTRERDALDRASAEEARRRQAESDTRAAGAARAAAERDTQAAAAARDAAQRDAQTAADARLAAERDTQRAAVARDAAERDRADANAARVAAENARTQAESAQRAAEAQTQQAKDAAEQSERDKVVLRGQLRDQLNVVLETRETARGLIVNLSDVLFDTASSNLKPGAREKLSRVSGILVSHPGLRLEIEGHTDSVGTDAYNQGLSSRRAESVRVYLVDQRIPSDAVGALGLGEGHPVATNDTAAGRQQNRRVEMIVSGDIIGTR
jgi:outer membrane protein OmpA-like peptidoglycan-associated protein